MVQLQAADGQAAYVAQRQHALADIVDREIHVGGRGHVTERATQFLRHDAFAHFQAHGGAGQAVAVQHAPETAGKIGAPQLRGRQVGADKEILAQHPAPLRQLRAQAVQNPVADLKDQPAGFGNVQKLRRMQHAYGRSMPAQQRLRTDETCALQIQQRLVEQFELAAQQALLEAGREFLTALRDGVGVRRSHAVGVAPAALGRVHGFIGHPQQSLGVAAMIRIHRNADAQTKLQRASGGLQRGIERAQYSLGDAAFESGWKAFGQHHQFIPTHPRQQLARTAYRGQALRHGDQHGVADVVAEGVVDLLEAVQIQIQHRHPTAVAIGTRQCRVELLVQAHRIGKAGQCVVFGAKLQRPGGRTALGRVVQAHDRGAAGLRQRTAFPLKRAAVGRSPFLKSLVIAAQVQAMAVQIGLGPAQQSPGCGVCQGDSLIRFQQQHAVRIGREGQVDLRLPERSQQLAAAEITPQPDAAGRPSVVEHAGLVGRLVQHQQQRQLRGECGQVAIRQRARQRIQGPGCQEHGVGRGGLQRRRQVLGVDRMRIDGNRGGRRQALGQAFTRAHGRIHKQDPPVLPMALVRRQTQLPRGPGTFPGARYPQAARAGQPVSIQAQ